MKNRYDSILREYNHKIITLSPANETLRYILALAFNKQASIIENPKILELACGEGNQTKFILEYNPSIKIDALDVSKEMLTMAKANLTNFNDKINYICSDTLDFLKKTKSAEYDFIISTWFIHNLNQFDKKSILNEVLRVLKPKGKLLLMDKVYFENAEINKDLLKKQLERYKFLFNEDAQKAITQHEEEDFTKEFIMTENKLLRELKSVGFSNVKILDRIERDVVLTAQK